MTTAYGALSCLHSPPTGQNISALHAAQFERAEEKFQLDGQSRVHMQSEAPAGNITVTLAFTYTLSSGLSGFYRTEYQDLSSGADGVGIMRVVAATQFESMSARKSFPCLDEPALKVLLLSRRL